MTSNVRFRNHAKIYPEQCIMNYYSVEHNNHYDEKQNIKIITLLMVLNYICDCEYAIYSNTILILLSIINIFVDIGYYKKIITTYLCLYITMLIYAVYNLYNDIESIDVQCLQIILCLFGIMMITHTDTSYFILLTSYVMVLNVEETFIDVDMLIECQLPLLAILSIILYIVDVYSFNMNIFLIKYLPIYIILGYSNIIFVFSIINYYRNKDDYNEYEHEDYDNEEQSTKEILLFLINIFVVITYFGTIMYFLRNIDDYLKKEI